MILSLKISNSDESMKLVLESSDSMKLVLESSDSLASPLETSNTAALAALLETSDADALLESSNAAALVALFESSDSIAPVAERSDTGDVERKEGEEEYEEDQTGKII